jgi:hypothetical protein
MGDIRFGFNDGRKEINMPESFMGLTLNLWQEFDAPPNRPGQRENVVFHSIGHAITDDCASGPNLNIPHKHARVYDKEDAATTIIECDDNKIAESAALDRASWLMTPSHRRTGMFHDFQDGFEQRIIEAGDGEYPLFIIARGNIHVVGGYESAATGFDVSVYNNAQIVTLFNGTGADIFSTSHDSNKFGIYMASGGVVTIGNLLGESVDVLMNLSFAYTQKNAIEPS